jgi:hypothetical protein
LAGKLVRSLSEEGFPTSGNDTLLTNLLVTENPFSDDDYEWIVKEDFIESKPAVKATSFS